jgi:drug/metabolite transporter (DMT)-like permease
MVRRQYKRNPSESFFLRTRALQRAIFQPILADSARSSGPEWLAARLGRRIHSNPMLTKRVRADLALVFCALIWGSTFVVVKNALADASVFVYIAVRFGLSAIIMAILFWRSLRELNRQAIWAGAQIGFFMLGGYGFQTAGLQYTTASKAAFITGCSVVLVPVLLALFGRGMNAWIWSGAMAAVAGLYLLTVPPEGLGALNRGDVLVFLCSIMFALHIIFVSRYVARYPFGSLAFLQVATTAVLSALLVPLLAATRLDPPRLAWTTTLLVALLLTSIGSTVMGFSFQVWAQKHTSPGHAAILLSLEPVFASLTSWFLTREHLGPRSLVGGALIFVGILLAELKGAAPAAPESPEPIAYPAKH